MTSFELKKKDFVWISFDCKNLEGPDLWKSERQCQDDDIYNNVAIYGQNFVNSNFGLKEYIPFFALTLTTSPK